MANERTKRVKTVQKSLQIIEFIFENGRVSRSDIEKEFDLAPSTVYRHLRTLEDNGYVLEREDGYDLSFKFLTIGGDLRRDITAYSMIKRKVDDLAAETNERAQFLVRERTERVYVYTEIGENPVQTGAQPGKRGLLHPSAAGKSILAFLPEQKRESLIDALDLRQTGPNTITDPDELRESLADIRDRGYALNKQETTKGVHAIGAPVLNEQDEVIGAISISGPGTRLTVERMETEVLQELLATTNELELHIEHGRVGSA